MGNDAFGFFLIFFRRTNISSVRRLSPVILDARSKSPHPVSLNGNWKEFPTSFFKSAPRPPFLTVREPGVWKEGFSHLATQVLFWGQVLRFEVGREKKWIPSKMGGETSISHKYQADRETLSSFLFARMVKHKSFSHYPFFGELSL